ncbi:MAG: PD40 domain-containing protein [Planctomycetes bacterium]|nr:PD40 domain-containing protein [Planctomycetota bacterium]
MPTKRIVAATLPILLILGCELSDGPAENPRPGLTARPETPPFAIRGRTNEGALAIHTFSRTGGDNDPCVSSDGNWLAFSSTRHTKQPQIYLKRVDSQVVTRRTFSEFSSIQPKFSPDGSMLAYASNADGNWDIWIMPRDRGPSANLTADLTTDEIHPTWHPDRPILAFSSYDPASGDWYVCIRSRRTGGLQILTPGLFPEWSPDGKKIVYQRARERGVRWYSVWMVDVTVDANDNVDCSQPVELVWSDRWAAINPAWCPDNKHVTFASVYKSPEARNEKRIYRGDDIWMVGVDGRDLVRLTTTSCADWDPWWAQAPSGGVGRIYFTSLMNGNCNIWSFMPVMLDVPGTIESNRESEADAAKDIISKNLEAQEEGGTSFQLGTRVGGPEYMVEPQ